MVIEPKIMNNICLTSHPVGCEAIVKRDIEWVKTQPKITMPKRVLVLGCSTGFGLATRISAAFSGGADTLGVSFEKEGSAKRPGTPGFYNNRTFDAAAQAEGLKAESINADAFSHDTRKTVIAKIKDFFEGGQVDMVVYSLASPVRTDPDTGEMYKSVLKTLKDPYTAFAMDLSGKLKSMTMEPASAEETAATIKVMGGEDWSLWVKALKEAGVLAQGIKTVAYTYIGSPMTFPIYREGTIGQAKLHLEASAKDLQKELSDLKGEAFISVNKALVTRSSAVIPGVSVYIALLFKIMKEKGTHEGCREQMQRMLTDKIYGSEGTVMDETGMVRMDDWELADDVQAEVTALWDSVDEELLAAKGDLEGFKKDYMELHGFEVEGVDYSADVDTL
ncbi:MAG: trans-2-enoyl-CoA reductase family protein [Spirochaetales bacterium]|nr:trans-2-enoyl-CoA reductase family protein [Spirochaetales bacterium]